MSKTYVPAQLRRIVAERAYDCCEYCLQPAAFAFCSHEIDHVIAEKHGGKTIENNLAFACKLCNTLKGSDLASIDPNSKEVVRLYQPRQDHWHNHFQCKEAELIPLTDIARTTVWLLQLNRADRLMERPLWLDSGLAAPVKRD
ncbi:MAG: HNH endonuclease signature motif containing protein [Cyanobacteria bacterium J06629_19]